jgi:hypothetical protein
MPQCSSSYHLCRHSQSTHKAWPDDQLVFHLWRQGRKGSRLALAGLTINIDSQDNYCPQSLLATPRRLMALPEIGEAEKDRPQFMDPFANSFSGTPTPARPSRSEIRHPASPILAAVRKFSTRFSSFATSEADSQCVQMASLNQLHSKLLGVVLRVSAYPVALIIVNILHTGGSDRRVQG